MADGTAHVEHRDEHIVALHTEELEVVYRALVQRWMHLEAVARDADLSADDLERDPDWQVSRRLSARIALTLVDHRNDPGEDCPPCTLG